MKEKLSAYRPAIAAFLVMMAMAITSTCISFFLGPICEHLQVGRGQVSLMFSLMTLTGAVSISFLGQHINKKGVRGVLMISAFWVAAGLLGLTQGVVGLAVAMGRLTPAVCVAGIGASVILRRKENPGLSFLVQFAGGAWYGITLLVGILSGSN